MDGLMESIYNYYKRTRSGGGLLRQPVAVPRASLNACTRAARLAACMASAMHVAATNAPPTR